MNVYVGLSSGEEISYRSVLHDGGTGAITCGIRNERGQGMLDLARRLIGFVVVAVGMVGGVALVIIGVTVVIVGVISDATG